MAPSTNSHRASRLLPFLLVGILGLSVAASAVPQPSLYWLRDGATGPVGDGLLDIYDPLQPNVPNGTQPHSRLIVAGADAVVPVRFLTPTDGIHTDRLKGPLLVGLWLGPSSVYKGNLTATLYEVQASGAHALASASVMLDADLNKTPDPVKLIPPTPPTPPTPDPSDPNATANYAQAQATSLVFYEAAQALPLILKPPVVFYMGVVDIPFNLTSQFAIGFSLTQGSSDLPVPMGGFGHVQYDYLLGPSYVYVPWYKADPPKPVQTATTPPPSASGSHSGTGHASSSSSESSSSESKGTPSIPVLPVVALLGLLGFALRRKL